MYQILIVDDEIELRNGLANYFPWNDLGFRICASCSDGHEACRILETQKIDVLLTDIVMPNMDGLALTAFIRERKLPVVVYFLSGYQEFEYAKRALELGVRQFIVKPTKYSELYKIFSALKEELDQADGLREASIQHKPDTQQQYYIEIIDKVKAFVKDNLQDVTLEKAAATVHLSPAYLSHVFKFKTDITLSDYILNKRLSRAKELLKDSGIRITQISESLGYSNPNNFTRAFKSMYNLTPTEYRAGILAEQSKAHADK